MFENYCNERQLGNGKYRYEGCYNHLSYCIDSIEKQTQDNIFDFLDDKSIDFLISMEGYVISL